VRRRFAPHQLRHAHAVDLAHEGVPLNVIQRQLGHTNLGVTSLGRDGARCRRYRRSVSPPRPPNRTGTFPRIRLSTGTSSGQASLAPLGPVQLCPQYRRLIRFQVSRGCFLRSQRIIRHHRKWLRYAKQRLLAAWR
jgi:hypothetical protein